MDRLPIGQRHHAENAGSCFAREPHLAPEAHAAIRLLLAMEWSGNDLDAPPRIDVGTLVKNPLLEVPCRLHTKTPLAMIARLPYRSSKWLILLGGILARSGSCPDFQRWLSRGRVVVDLGTPESFRGVKTGSGLGLCCLSMQLTALPPSRRRFQTTDRSASV